MAELSSHGGAGRRAWRKRPFGASGRDVSASVNINRLGGGAGSMEPSRSPGGAGRSGDAEGLEVSVSCSREYTEL